MDKNYLKEHGPLPVNVGPQPPYYSVEKAEWMMGFAEQAAKRSPDAETKVGCALFNSQSGALLSIGFNGFVRGANDAALPKFRPEKYQYMVHAEVNMIANCAKHGISMQGCELFCTLSPCVSCMRNLWNCGITRIYVKELYKDFEDIKKMRDLHVTAKVVGLYYVLEYCPYV